jgi:hypothetical protein
MNLQDPSYPTIPATQSQGWTAFTYMAFVASILSVGTGIVFLPIEIWMRGYLGIGVLMVIQSCLTLAKTQRNAAESARLVNRIETAGPRKFWQDLRISNSDGLCHTRQRLSE